MTNRTHPQLNGSFELLAKLNTATSVIADYQGKVSVILEGPMETANHLSSRRKEIDGQLIGAAIDGKKIQDPAQKVAFYNIFRAGLIKAYKGGEPQALKHGLDDREPLVALREALGMNPKGDVVREGRIGATVAETYNHVVQDFESQLGAGAVRT